MNTVGSGQYRYRVIEDWAKLPEGWQFGILVGVAVDSQDRVYVCHQRQDPPIIVFDRQGSYICSWGTGDINEGHIMSITSDDVMCLVDRGAHQALRLEAGRGAAHGVGAEGASFRHGIDCHRRRTPASRRTVQYADPDVLRPLRRHLRFRRIPQRPDPPLLHRAASLSHHGEFRARAHQGSSTCPTAFGSTHRGLVYVCDRKNNRVQVFSPEGEFISQWEGLTSPVDMCMDGDENVFLHEGGAEEESPRITVLDKTGNRCRLGGIPPMDTRFGWTPTTISTWRCAGSSAYRSSSVRANPVGLAGQVREASTAMAANSSAR